MKPATLGVWYPTDGMSANDAQTRFGSDLQGGAILVTLRR